MQIAADCQLDHGDKAVVQGRADDDVFQSISGGTNRLVMDEWLYLCSGCLCYSFVMKGMMKRKRAALLLV